jgi:hypothetical protein
MLQDLNQIGGNQVFADKGLQILLHGLIHFDDFGF